MRKISGWLTIILCSIILLIIIVTPIALIPSIMSGSSTQMSAKEIICAIIGFIISISLLILGLRDGIKKIKRKSDKKFIEYESTLNIIVSGKISYRDYRNLIMGLSIKKPAFLLCLGLLILCLLSMCNNGNYHELPDTIWVVFFIFAGIVATPLLVLYQTKKAFKTNKIFKEEVLYNFNNDAVEFKGKSFNSTIAWSHFIKIKETKTFFMLYQDNIVANLIDKKMLTENEITELRKFITSLNVDVE